MKLTWQDVKEIYHRHNNKIFTCWIAIADELQAHVDAPEPNSSASSTTLCTPPSANARAVARPA